MKPQECVFVQVARLTFNKSLMLSLSISAKIFHDESTCKSKKINKD